ncbi:MAG TPA: T9SS type A sorting domain-containing protein [Candidatus Marinimicrobia bacterium]|nr:T9SS type A sorting domain-containing protein [Candidatus Neomarinimicrobiota bacterium]HRS50800.1 T9SS type A sorting domain-containing protein [Candidatus Neomarinimicrobiota bacterium]
MIKKYPGLILVLSIGIFSKQIPAQTIAFPGAEGSGRFAKGGRGGEVYEVTNLNNSGAGSIVDAVSKSNRTVIFRISGTIELGSVILQPKSNITIAGQTAPGDGICLKGRIKISNNHIIIRYIRVRVDAGAANSSGDAIDIDKGKNIIIDHVSASYARDETISCQENSDSVTVQWCLMSEALTFEGHSYGSLVRGDFGDQKTYHHNLYAHCNGRLPRPGNYTSAATDTLGLFFDFRNNVVYNWAGSSPGYNADKDPISHYNFIGNVYVLGPESSTSSKLFKEDAYNAYGYFADNMFNGVVPEDQWSLVKFNGFTTDRITAYKQRSSLIPMEPVTTTSPEQAYLDVLASAGCNFPKRDTIDRRIVQDVINATGHSIANTSVQPEGGWPLLSSLPAPTDTDHDGMPDDWEISHSLNPADAADRNLLDENGYTHLENYLNGLVEQNPNWIVSKPDVFANFRLAQNYPNPFNATTTIQFSLFKTGMAEIRIYDLAGRIVKTYPRQSLRPGEYRLVWQGDNDAGKPVASGIYFCVMQFAENRQILKMQIIR